MPKAKPKEVFINARVSYDERIKLQKIADEFDLSVSSLIRLAVADYVKRRKPVATLKNTL